MLYIYEVMKLVGYTIIKHVINHLRMNDEILVKIFISTVADDEILVIRLTMYIESTGLVKT